jgi:hypothetical protein
MGSCCLTGCSALWEDRPDARAVSLAEFSQPIPAGTIVGASPHLQQGAQASEQEATTDHEGTATPPTTPGAGDVVAGSSSTSGSAPSGATTQQKPAVAKPSTSTPSNTLTPESTRGGDVWIVDALVGQINGRPVFAQEFLEPIEAKLIELAQASDRLSGWRQAQMILEARFEDFVNSELIISEAESQLTPEQQQGFFGWVKSLQEGTIAEYSGSREEARERMRDELGMDIEEFVQQRRDASLVQYLLDRKVKPRTIVAWRDIEREYLAREGEFNPPQMVVVGILTLNANVDADKVAKVQAWIAEGKRFPEIAQSLQLEKGGVLIEIPVKPGEDVAAAIDGSADLTPTTKTNLRGLTPGQLSPAIERGDSRTWLAIAEVKQDPPRSLYDPKVQIQLRRELDAIRGGYERGRYIERLRSRWVSDDIERILSRLKEIALERYWRQ